MLWFQLPRRRVSPTCGSCSASGTGYMPWGASSPAGPYWPFSPAGATREPTLGEEPTLSPSYKSFQLKLYNIGFADWHSWLLVVPWENYCYNASIWVLDKNMQSNLFLAFLTWLNLTNVIYLELCSLRPPKDSTPASAGEAQMSPHIKDISSQYLVKKWMSTTKSQLCPAPFNQLTFI